MLSETCPQKVIQSVKQQEFRRHNSRRNSESNWFPEFETVRNLYTHMLLGLEAPSSSSWGPSIKSQATGGRRANHIISTSAQVGLKRCYCDCGYCSENMLKPPEAKQQQFRHRLRQLGVFENTLQILAWNGASVWNESGWMTMCWTSDTGSKMCKALVECQRWQ